MYKIMNNRFEFELKLGDIIVIESPNDLYMNEKKFLITYIDNNQFDIVSQYDHLVSSIFINKDGSINSSTIKNINILVRPPQDKEGYARHYGLVLGKWIKIFFSEKFIIG